MTDCLFCKIIRGEIPAAKVYEDEATFAFLDLKPVNPGHTLVIPKAHAAGIVDASDETLAAVMCTVKKIAPGILTAVGAEAFNLGVNEGAVAGQLVPHLHIHVMPRFPNDGHKLWHGTEASMEDRLALAEKIRTNLS